MTGDKNSALLPGAGESLTLRSDGGLPFPLPPITSALEAGSVFAGLSYGAWTARRTC